MTTRKTSTLVPYSAADMFALVADVEKYPEFLPWCPALRVVERSAEGDDEVVIADMMVAYKVFREQFRCKIELNHGQKTIDVGFVNGPFRHLETNWHFEDVRSDQSKVHFCIDFELKNIVLQTAAQAFFEVKFSQMADAFIERAHALAGIPGKTSI